MKHSFPYTKYAGNRKKKGILTPPREKYPEISVMIRPIAKDSSPHVGENTNRARDDVATAFPPLN